MPIAEYDGSTTSIRELADRPLLTAADLKEKFDHDLDRLVEWINGTLLPYINGIKANQVGFMATPEVAASNVQQAIVSLSRSVSFAAAAVGLPYTASPTVGITVQPDGTKLLTFGIPLGTPTISDGMAVSTYDTHGRGTDIFDYVDARQPVEDEVEIAADGWDADSYWVDDERIGSGAVYDVFPAEGATDEEAAAWDNCRPRLLTGSGGFYIVAHGTVPSIDLPLVLRIYKSA